MSHFAANSETGGEMRRSGAFLRLKTHPVLELAAK